MYSDHCSACICDYHVGNSGLFYSPRESGSGFAIGIALDLETILVMGMQCLGAMTIAWFIEPRVINALKQLESPMLVGIKAFLVCWTLPWFFLSIVRISLTASGRDWVMDILLAIVPAIAAGPPVSYLLVSKCAIK